jgi:hypothetical protein
MTALADRPEMHDDSTAAFRRFENQNLSFYADAATHTDSIRYHGARGSGGHASRSL